MDTTSYDDFQDAVRGEVLRALDDLAAEFGTRHGWRDKDLPALFAAIDAHALGLARRINEASEGRITGVPA